MFNNEYNTLTNAAWIFKTQQGKDETVFKMKTEKQIKLPCLS